MFHAGQGIPGDFFQRTQLLGGTVEGSLDSIGVAVVTGLSDYAADSLAAMSDVAFVEPDMTSPVISEEEALAASDVSDADNVDLSGSAAVPDVAATNSSPSDAKFFAGLAARRWRCLDM